jgi:hypothetical protein
MAVRRIITADADVSGCGTSTLPRKVPPIGTGIVSRFSVDWRKRSQRNVSRAALMSITRPARGNSSASHAI